MHDVNIGSSTHKTNPNHYGAVDIKTLNEQIFRVGKEVKPVDELQDCQNPYMFPFNFEKLK